MMTMSLEMWLAQATKCLSKDSARQVGSEILEHYQLTREAAIHAGSEPEEAGRLALEALGDPKIANEDYRRVLLTSSEAKILREGNWEARALCSHHWFKWLLTAGPVGVLIASAAEYANGNPSLARDLFAGSIVLGILIAAPFLPVYTPTRARVYRTAKWIVYMGALMVVIPWPWLLATSLWPLAWSEWTRVSIRRKLPVSQWPKHLYL